MQLIKSASCHSKAPGQRLPDLPRKASDLGGFFVLDRSPEKLWKTRLDRGLRKLWITRGSDVAMPLWRNDALAPQGFPWSKE
jgi:hypothetical protein